MVRALIKRTNQALIWLVIHGFIWGRNCNHPYEESKKQGKIWLSRCNCLGSTIVKNNRLFFNKLALSKIQWQEKRLQRWHKVSNLGVFRPTKGFSFGYIFLKLSKNSWRVKKMDIWIIQTMSINKNIISFKIGFHISHNLLKFSGVKLDSSVCPKINNIVGYCWRRPAKNWKRKSLNWR